MTLERFKLAFNTLIFNNLTVLSFNPSAQKPSAQNPSAQKPSELISTDLNPWTDPPVISKCFLL